MVKAKTYDTLSEGQKIANIRPNSGASVESLLRWSASCHGRAQVPVGTEKMPAMDAQMWQQRRRRWSVEFRGAGTQNPLGTHRQT